MIKAAFKALIKNYEERSSEMLWEEIVTKHTEPSRHYHKLSHLEDLYDQLLAVKGKIENWNTVLFTLFYHDIIYNSSKSNNEEKSAALAKKRMQQIEVPNDEIELCIKQIIATKKHLKSEDSDTNYFTDADLSILGRDSESYYKYCEKIRREYAIYPMFIYKRGRKKVVKHFLSMERIYKTEAFFNKYEKQAKSNLQAELDSLN